MRLYTVTIAVRLKDNGDPDFDVDIDVEDGVPQEVLDTIGKAVQNVGKSIEKKIAEGTHSTSVRA